MIEYQTQSPQETTKLASEFARGLKLGNAIALCGNLGAGKTCLAKGIISTLAKVPTEEITSPTFTIIEEYPIKVDCRGSMVDGVIYHVDLYRLDTDQELQELPWDDLFSSQAITVIEWPEKAKDLISHCQWEVNLVKQNKTQRRITIKKIDQVSPPC